MTETSATTGTMAEKRILKNRSLIVVIDIPVLKTQCLRKGVVIDTPVLKTQCPRKGVVINTPVLKT